MRQHDERSFGTQLRQYRERAGLTQEALAEQAGLTANAISALERGERQRPYLHTVEALVTALGLSAAERAELLAARSPRPGMPAPAPRLSMAAPMPALPPSLTPLIGRDAEVAAIAELVGRAEVQLVTLLGSGGVGKTRLALDVAAQLVPRFRDGVVWVPLAALNDPRLLIPAIAAAVEVRESGARPLHDLLCSALCPKQLLLVLDNLEHLLDRARYRCAAPRLSHAERVGDQPRAVAHPGRARISGATVGRASVRSCATGR